MREILFRGKTLNDNEWVIGAGVYKSEGYTWIITDDVTKTENRGTGSDAINPETVGQYTGLTDKNGKKIFEGDIVTVHLEIPYLPSQPKTISAVGVVEFNTEKSSYYVVSTSGEEYALCFIDEVIGNTHDNSELLKGA